MKTILLAFLLMTGCVSAQMSTNLPSHWFMTNGTRVVECKLTPMGSFDLWMYGSTGVGHLQMLDNGSVAFGQSEPNDFRWEIDSEGGAAVVSRFLIKTDAPWVVRPAFVLVDDEGVLTSTGFGMTTNIPVMGSCGPITLCFTNGLLHHVQ